MMNQLFRFLRSPFRAVGEAHRTNPRRHTSRPARLSWSAGATTRTIRGRLLDISRAGAAVLTQESPQVKTHVRLRLVGREPTPWVEATVVGIEPEDAGRRRIRLLFVDPCPTFFLRVAVLAPAPPDAEAAPPRETSSEMADSPLPATSP